MEDTLCIRTRDSLAKILSANNSAAWFLKVKRARAAKYLVCVSIDPDHPQHKRRAFLVAEISEVTLDSSASQERSRYAICFQRYALLEPLDQPVMTGSQNPVRWGQLADFISVEAERLAWEDAPPKTRAYSYSTQEPREAQGGLSVEEAKRGLAARFGVPEGAITITISV